MAKPCRRCGGEKGSGPGRFYCDDCQQTVADERRAYTRQWHRDHPGRPRKRYVKPLKPCRRCGGEKQRHARGHYCAACEVKLQTTAAQRARDYAKRYYREHRSEDRERNNEKQKRKLRESAALRQANLDRAKAWREANPERAAEIRRRSVLNYRARKLGAFVEEVEPLVVLERDDGVCGICGGDVDPTDFHVDHIEPLALGGEHSYANTQAAHPDCNRAKGGRV